MNPQKGRLTRTGLQLVEEDGSSTSRIDRFERAFEGPAPMARPADRCEPWPINDASSLRALAVAAAKCGVALELAAVLVVERALLTAELAPHGLGDLADRFDAEAACARVTFELSGSLSAYLAALSGRDRSGGAMLPSILALPMRLSERILAREGRPQFDATLLASALAWERAAVLEGRTMSEWAAVKTLELSR